MLQIKITERCRKVNKRFICAYADCRNDAENADSVIDVNILEDPTYKVVID
jgi:SulP family sulfate permease